jgi:cell division protein FtsQ
MSSELTKMSPSIFRSISEIHLSPKVSDPLHLTLYMNEGYEVSTTVHGFSEKMATYPLIIKTLQPDEEVRINLELGAYTERLNTEEKAQ